MGLSTSATHIIFFIAAVVIGGGSLTGGEGTVIGTLIGAFIMGLLTNGSDLLGVNPYWQQVIIGAYHRPFKGYIDEVRIYNRPLTATEVRKRFRHTASANLPPGLTMRFLTAHAEKPIYISDLSTCKPKKAGGVFWHDTGGTSRWWIARCRRSCRRWRKAVRRTIPSSYLPVTTGK